MEIQSWSLHSEPDLRVDIAKPFEHFEALLESMCAVEVEWVTSRHPLQKQSLTATALALAKKITGSEIHHDERGRPLAKDGDWAISLAHKEGLIAAAAARKPFAIGVDVERLNAIADPDVFIKYALAPAEREKIADYMQLWQTDLTGAVVTLWSLKESYFKSQKEDVPPHHLSFSVPDLTLSQWVKAEWKIVPLHSLRVHFLGKHVVTQIVRAEK